MKTIKYELEDGIATLTFDEPGSPVNTMCQQWQDDLTEVTAQVVKDKDAIRGILLASAKTTFFAGADLKATMRLQPSDAPRVFREIERTKKNFRTLETLGKPVVSCLNGSALGGGWELALVGHYRVAVDDPKIQFGLPEITLGLIPGASGITKMTRLLGLMGAQPYILESKLFGPREALQLGLIHDIVDDASGLRPAALAWIAKHASGEAPGHHPWDDKNYKMPGGTPSNPKIAGMLAVAPAVLKHKTRGLYPAPEYALAAMVEGAQVDFDTALRIESRYLAKLIVEPGGQEHDQHVLLQHERDQVGPVAAQGRAALQAEEGRPAGRRHDGRRHRLRAGQPRHRHGAQGRDTGQGRCRQGLQRQGHAAARRQGPDGSQRAGGPALAHHGHGFHIGPARLRSHHRSGVRKPRPEGARHAGSRTHAGGRRLLREQYVHLADHRPGQGQRADPRNSSASTSSARSTR